MKGIRSWRPAPYGRGTLDADSGVPRADLQCANEVSSSCGSSGKSSLGQEDASPATLECGQTLQSILNICTGEALPCRLQRGALSHCCRLQNVLLHLDGGRSGLPASGERQGESSNNPARGVRTWRAAEGLRAGESAAAPPACACNIRPNFRVCRNEQGKREQTDCQTLYSMPCCCHLPVHKLLVPPMHIVRGDGCKAHRILDAYAARGRRLGVKAGAVTALLLLLLARRRGEFALRRRQLPAPGGRPLATLLLRPLLLLRLVSGDDDGADRR